MTSRAVSLSVVLLAVAGTASAQSIPIQTVPLVPADQFDIFPSLTLAMGGVSIAVPDTLHDPFVNPAKGARLRAARFFSAPTFYSVSHDAGAGRTLPLGVFSTAGTWYGGLALALQQVDASHPSSPSLNFPGPFDTVFRLAAPLPSGVPDLSTGSESHGNSLAFALIGKELPGSGLSVGGSIGWAKLRALDGVDLLYPGTQQFLQSSRLERNRDFSKRWGVQVKYERPLAASEWRIGWLATFNRISQPNTPNSDVLNIPQDPGRATAYELGVGVSRAYGPSVFGMDVVYQPIWSTTWAEAQTSVVTVGGGTIPVGGRTVENGFHFSNALVRIGVSREVTLGPLTRTAALQLGLAVRSVHYNLAQQDHVEGVTRHLEESWLEWTPTWGLTFRFPELELRYRGRVSHGTDRLVASQNGFIANPVADVAPGFFPPVGSAMTLDDVHVVTHQFSVSLPLR